MSGAAFTYRELAGAVAKSSLPSASRLALKIIGIESVGERGSDDSLIGPVSLSWGNLADSMGCATRTAKKHVMTASAAGWVSVSESAGGALFEVALTGERLKMGRQWIAEVLATHAEYGAARSGQ